METRDIKRELTRLLNEIERSRDRIGREIYTLTQIENEINALIDTI